MLADASSGRSDLLSLASNHLDLSLSTATSTEGISTVNWKIILADNTQVKKQQR